MEVKSGPKQQIPAVEGFFTMPPEEPHLIGTKCNSCGSVFFPRVKSCRAPFCEQAKPAEDVLLSRRGKLFTFTVNYYQPPPPYHPPTPFAPFAVAVVELPEGITVQGMVVPGHDEKTLRIGMEMELVVDKLYEDEQGNDIMAWKFRPAQN